MSMYKFLPNDVLVNQIKLHPEVKFFIYNGSVYYNNRSAVSGTHTDSVTAPVGNLSLYELNIDRHADNRIYPFVTKQGSLTSFKTVSDTSFNTSFNYGDTLNGSYPLTASISRKYYTDGETDLYIASTATNTRKRVEALRNTIDHYSTWNPDFQVSSSIRDLTSAEMSVFEIPSIFYGSSLEKGSVELNFYITGSLVGTAQDVYRNGSLIQTYPDNMYSGSNVGLVLYNEGLILTYNQKEFVNNKALQLNGTDEFLDLYFGTKDNTKNVVNGPDNTRLNLDPQQNFTISVWIKTSTAHGTILRKGSPGEDDGYGLYVASSKFTAVIGGISLTTTTNVADGAWHHVAVVNYNDDGVQKFQTYVDGAAEGTAVASGKLRGNNYFYIGKRLSTFVSNVYYTGHIDELSIWDHNMSVLEIADLYNDGDPNDLNAYSDSLKIKYTGTDHLLAWYRFGDHLGWQSNGPKNVLSADLQAKGQAPLRGYSVDSSNLTTAYFSSLYSGLGIPHKEAYTGGTALSASWAHFGASMKSGITTISSSFEIGFKGTTFTPVMTMFAHAPQGALNYSSNPTFVDKDSRISASLGIPLTSSALYEEPENVLIKNTATSSYTGYEEKMKRQTFISKVGIYDENKNLIAIAKLATPIRKEEKDEYVFKLKLDL